MRRRISSLILATILLGAFAPAAALAQTATPTSVPTATPTPIATATTTATPAATTTATATATTTATPITTTSTLYVPIAVKSALGGDDSGIQVQNNSGAAATVNLAYYDQGGNQVATEGPSTVQAGGSVTFYQPAVVTLPAGFDGSAVVTSTQPIAAIVNRVNYVSALASTGSLTVPTAGATQYTVPLVYGGLNGYATTLSMQNAGTTTETLTVNLHANGVSGVTATTQRSVPPNAVWRLRVGTEISVPSSFIGTAQVTSGGGSLIAVGETRNTSNSIWLGYSGVATGSTTMNAPLLFKNYTVGWVSGAQVANLSNATITVNGSVRSRDDNTTFSLPTMTLGPNQGNFYDLATTGGLPDGFVGSGVFTATGPIGLTVQQVAATPQTGMGYNGFASGTARISVPLIFKDSGGWDTGVQVQNLGVTPSSVLITYFGPTGNLLASDTLVIQPNDSGTFYQPANPNLPTGLVGSATVSSDGQPIAAIVNEVNYLRGGDASMTYEGINF